MACRGMRSASPVPLATALALAFIASVQASATDVDAGLFSYFKLICGADPDPTRAAVCSVEPGRRHDR